MVRDYDNSLRTDRAAATRERIIQAAIDTFTKRGYAGTRMSDIAERAGVSTDTVNVNGPKSALLQAAIEVASFGREGEHLIFEFDLGKRLQETADLDDVATVLADGLSDLNARVAVLWAILTAEALVTPELASRHEAMLASVIRSADAFVASCEERGWTDPPRAGRVAKILTAGSTDSYLRLRKGMGWSPDDYRAWVRNQILSALRD